MINESPSAQNGPCEAVGMSNSSRVGIKRKLDFRGKKATLKIVQPQPVACTPAPQIPRHKNEK